VSACAALPHDQSGPLWDKTVTINGVARTHLEALISWTGLIGVVGLPAAVPPVGRTAAGLPVGIQAVAAYLRDREALQFARLVSEVLGGFVAPPEFA
jgi:amidase